MTIIDALLCSDPSSKLIWILLPPQPSSLAKPLATVISNSFWPPSSERTTRLLVSSDISVSGTLPSMQFHAFCNPKTQTPDNLIALVPLNSLQFCLRSMDAFVLSWLFWFSPFTCYLSSLSVCCWSWGKWCWSLFCPTIICNLVLHKAVLLISLETSFPLPI